MSPSSSEDDDADERVPYSRRPEWADVEPIPQPESANPVVLIDYADEYVDAMDVWRAVYRSRERSRRVLDLTRDVIGMNGGAYTVWHHRWELVSALGVDLAEELRYAGTMARANPKNYQVWNHMRLCSQAMKASGDDAGWHPAADVKGFLGGEEATVSNANGTTYLVYEVRHAGIVQVRLVGGG